MNIHSNCSHAMSYSILPPHTDTEGDTTASQSDEEDEDEQASDSELDDGEVEDEGDRDFDPEEDPAKLWCFCKNPHGNRFMICCDTCEYWFHGDCVGISMAMGREMEKTGEEWCCNKCKGNIRRKVHLILSIFRYLISYDGEENV